MLNNSCTDLEKQQLEHEKALDFMEKEFKNRIEALEEDEKNVELELYDLNIRKGKLDDMHFKYI